MVEEDPEVTLDGGGDERRGGHDEEGAAGSPVIEGSFTVFVTILVNFDVIVDSSSEDATDDDSAVLDMYTVLVGATELDSRPGSKIIG